MFRVLCVDDEDDILEVSKEFLEASGQIIVDTANSVADAKRAILSNEYDAIVSDYQMPGTDGLSFLKELRNSGYQIPFILFTGRGREEVVIEALNSGANFYLQKGGNPKAQFAELVHKIKVAIDRRAAENSLKESEALFHSLADNVFDGMVVHRDGVILDVNRSFMELTGYDRVELVGKLITDYFTEDTRKTVLKEYAQPSIRPYIARMVKKDGVVLTVEVRGNFVNWKGKPARLAAIQNVSDRMGFEDRIRNSEEMLNLALEGSDLGCWDWYVQSDRIEINDRLAGMLGYTVDEISPFTFEVWKDLLHPDDVTRAMEDVEQYFNGTNAEYEHEARLRHKDGHWVWVLSKGRISKRDDAGRPLRMCGTHLDISRMKKAEEALKESERKYRSLVESADEGILVIQDGRVCLANPKSSKIIGTSLENIISKPYLTAVYKEDRKKVIMVHEDRIAGRPTPERYDIRIVGEDGVLRWVSVSGIVIEWEGGPATLNLLTDITERKRVEGALRESEERIRLIMNSATEAVFGLDTDGKCTFCNESCVKMLGYDGPEALLGRYMHELVHNKNADGTQHNIEECQIFSSIRTGVRSHADNEVLWRADGTPLQIEYWSNPQIIGGTVVGAVMTFLDVTDRKRMEGELRIKADELEMFSESLASANRKLSLLNSITRHDLMNQITALSGYIELCNARAKDETVKIYLGKMTSSLGNIQRQINSMKEYQDIGVKAPVWGSMSKQLKDAFSALGPKEVTLEDDAGSIEYLADPLAEKVPYNLVDNSIRHGKHVGRIRLSARREGDAMVLVYEDDGEGISEEDKERIFEKGFGKNTGFGMFLSREILAITGISIIETGEPGKGVRFEMRIPPGAWRNKSESL